METTWGEGTGWRVRRRKIFRAICTRRMADAESVFRGDVHHPASSERTHLRHHCGQVADPHQVVGGHREGEDPFDRRAAPVPQLAPQGHRLQPAEDLLDALALHLTDRIARMPGGA